ncbi:hypothetical protein IFR05_015847, partial [Cadophora sp. M221]
MTIVSKVGYGEARFKHCNIPILNSRLFKFVVGEAADGTPTEFYVHEDAIAQLSTPLRTLVKSRAARVVGGNSASPSVVWKDVSKETFERFVQFAYTGNYSIPKTEERGVSSAVPPKRANGIQGVENGVAPNGIRGRVDSLGSDETSPVEATRARDISVSEKTEEDGTILNYPIPIKKHKKKKPSKAAIERATAEKESKEAAVLKPEPEPEPKPETTMSNPEPEPETKQDETQQPTETQ